jgi:uncharacterized protein YecE (DUF72 family)
MTIRIGTSGWVYKHWRGLFYPPEMRPAAWFDYYAGRFDTVEINNSFYRLPSEAAFAAWQAQAPPGFLYAVKASRYLTHLRKLKEPEEPLDRFFSRVAALGSTLGPVLYQLPPRWRLNLPRFEHFLAALPTGYRHAIEFREPSWLCEAVFAQMERYGVALCIHDMPPVQIPLRVTAPFVYLRFHGYPTYAGNYEQSALEEWATRIADWQRQGLDVYAYFNNDIGGHAIHNAQTLRSLVGNP